jgi:uncharacterized delta-60 repeat protein
MTFHGFRSIALVAASLLALSAPAHAAPGDLDTSFGSTGIVTLDFGLDATIGGMTLDADGKILVVGTTGSDMLVARIEKDGTPDTTFGEDHDGDGVPDGYRVIDLGGNETAREVLVDSTGLISVLGSSDSSGYLYSTVTRLLQDGSTDTSYAVNWATPGTAWNCIDSIGQSGTLDSADRVFLFSNQSPALNTAAIFMLFSSAGDPMGGIACDPVSTSTGGAITASRMALEPGTDKPLLAGNTGSDGFVARGNAGYTTFDLGYGANGVTVLSHLQIGTTPTSIVRVSGVTADDDPASTHYQKAVVVADTDSKLVVARLDLNGALDSSFNSKGYRRIDLGGADFGRAVAMGISGRIIALGESDGNPAVVRVNKNGTLDSTFGTNGKVVTPITGPNAMVSVKVTKESKIVAAGTNGNIGFRKILLVRYLGN